MNLKNKIRNFTNREKFEKGDRRKRKNSTPISRDQSVHGWIHLPISIESNSSSTRDGGSRGVTGRSRRSARRATGAGDRRGRERKGQWFATIEPKGTRVTCTTRYRSRSALLLRDRVPYLKLPLPPLPHPSRRPALIHPRAISKPFRRIEINDLDSPIDAQDALRAREEDHRPASSP